MEGFNIFSSSLSSDLLFHSISSSLSSSSFPLPHSYPWFYFYFQVFVLLFLCSLSVLSSFSFLLSAFCSSNYHFLILLHSSLSFFHFLRYNSYPHFPFAFHLLVLFLSFPLRSSIHLYSRFLFRSPLSFRLLLCLPLSALFSSRSSFLL